MTFLSDSSIDGSIAVIFRAMFLRLHIREGYSWGYFMSVLEGYSVQFEAGKPQALTVGINSIVLMISPQY